MGVNLTPIIVKRLLDREELAGRRLAVDAHAELYQFLALIRVADGSPLKDARGNVTSHLSGLLFRTTRLISDLQVQPVFVFDGKPPELKGAEIERRREIKERYQREYEEALAAGDLERAFSKATMTSRLTPPMVEDAKRLLTLLGIAHVQAPGEGEAQAAFMAARGDAWAACSKDYDSLLFGAPRLVRFLAVSGREFLPSKGTSRAVPPEVIETAGLLAHLGISRDQLVDLALLIGTDFNEGVRGVGPKTALRLIRQYGRIEELPDEVRERVPPHYDAVRDLYRNPEVTADYRIEAGGVDEPGLTAFLCGERGFAPDRVRVAVERLQGGPSGPAVTEDGQTSLGL